MLWMKFLSVEVVWHVLSHICGERLCTIIMNRVISQAVFCQDW